MKEKKKERTRRILIPVPVDVPESEYERLERFSELSGLHLETLYRVGKRCPACLEVWEPLVKAMEREKGEKERKKGYR